MTIRTISPAISLIDGYDLGISERTGTYVLHEEQITLVESGPSPSVPHVLAGLKQLGIHQEEVKYVIVTHIHLDHAGGAGLLLQECPNATLLVHPKGARHLINPTRLIQGAKAVYGKQFDQLFSPIIEVAEDRVMTMEDQSTLKISEECTLTFYDTPGHAAHHFSIHDSKSNGIFTGDTLGVHYELLAKDGHHLVLPSTSPNQFDPGAMLQSLEKIKELNVDSVYFGHFSASYQPEIVYKQVQKWLPAFVEVGQSVYNDNGQFSDISERLLLKIQEELDQITISRDHPVYDHIRLDLKVCAMGIFDYLQKQNRT